MENNNPRQFITRLTGTTLHEAVFHFEEKDRQTLLATLNEYVVNLPSATTEAFIGAVELAIARFTTLQALEKEKIRGTVLRDNLQELDAAAVMLQTALGKFDDQDSRFVLELCIEYSLGPVAAPAPAPSTEEEVLAQINAARKQGVAAREFIEDFAKQLEILRQVISLAQTIKFDTRSGPRKDYLRLALATDVAELFLSYLGIEPTTTQAGDFTQEGLYTQVLRIVLHAVGINTQDLHRLVGQAVKQTRLATP